MEKQVSWLKEELSHSKQTCTLAFWHHPAYSSGGHGNNPHMHSIWKILAAAKADIVLTSHDHDYERFAPLDGNGDRDDKNGIRSFVVGTGGAKLTPMFLPKAGNRNPRQQYAWRVETDAAGKSYEWEFLPVQGATSAIKARKLPLTFHT
jgi:hypothetical protein